MTDDHRRRWFEPRRYGYGATPVTWQGWAITIAFIAGALGVITRFGGRPRVELAILLRATMILLTVTARTTRGGWRWRWDDDD